MILKLYLKEWRENLLIISLAILLMLALSVLSFTEQKTLTLYFSGMFLWLFLPFSALLIGSGAFYSEFKDNAWIYIFSRPIRKDVVWIVKYAAAVSVLIFIYLFFSGLMHIMPGLSEFLLDLEMSTQFSGLSLSLMALTIAFSLSFLHEKQFIIVFSALLIGVALSFLSQAYLRFLYRQLFYLGDLKALPYMIGISFAAASIWTLKRCDFSQMGRKIFSFTKSLLLLLLISITLTLGWAARGRMLRRNPISWIAPLKHDGSLYFFTYTRDPGRSISRYNPETGTFELLEGLMEPSWDAALASGGGKIAFINRRPEGSGIDREDVAVIAFDGTGSLNLLESENPGSPFHNWRFGRNCALTSDGEYVAFTAFPPKGDAGGGRPNIWWMKADGTEIRGRYADLTAFWRLYILAWAGSGQGLIFMAEPRSLAPEERMMPLSPANKLLIHIDLASGVVTRLHDRVLSTSYRISLSPTAGHLVFSTRDSGPPRDTLYLLDLNTMESKKIFQDRVLKLWQVRWSPAGDRFAFSRADELWVHSLDTGTTAMILKWKEEQQYRFDWVQGGEKLALLEKDGSRFRFKLLGRDHRVEKEHEIPAAVNFPLRFWGLDESLLIRSRPRGAFWQYRLDSEEWKKVG